MAKNTILVVGGGTMGRGIAGLCALSGFGTAIFEADAAVRGRLRAAIEDSWNRAARRGKVSAESVEAARGLLRILERLDEGKGAGIVIEAVPESPEAKASVFASLATGSALPKRCSVPTRRRFRSPRSRARPAARTVSWESTSSTRSPRCP